MIQLTWWDNLRKFLRLACRWCRDTGHVRLHQPPFFNNCTIACPCGAEPKEPPPWSVIK